MPDLWNECFNPSMGMTPNEFEQTFCRQCRNPVCDRSAGSGLRWLKRIMTQEERLLNNPKFADPNDPRFQEIRSVEFPSALKEAMKLEISERRGDWTVPTELDTQRLVAEMRSSPLSQIVVPPTPAAPPPVQATPPVVEDDDDDDPVGRILRRMDISGSGKSVYQVTLLERIVGRPEWMCTCKAFEFGRARPCKHIEYAMTVPEEVEPPPKPVPAGPPPARFQAPRPPNTVLAATPAQKNNPPVVKPPTGGVPKQPFYPTQPNIPMPSGGIMIDGSAPPPPKERGPNRPTSPQADSWAPAPATTKPNVIPVGGRVVMGGKPPGDKK